VGVQKGEDIMKVKFRDNHLIFRTSVEKLIYIIMSVATRDGDEEEAIEILQTMGWTGEELTRFDNEWAEYSENLEIEIGNEAELYKEVKKRINLEQYWCMK
jgi:hypothetical protein